MHETEEQKKQKECKVTPRCEDLVSRICEHGHGQIQKLVKNDLWLLLQYKFQGQHSIKSDGKKEAMKDEVTHQFPEMEEESDEEQRD